MSHDRLESKIVKCRKPKQCDACYLMIEKGDTQHTYKWVDGGEFETSYTHAECYEELVDGPWIEDNLYMLGCLVEDFYSTSQKWRAWYYAKRRQQRGTR